MNQVPLSAGPWRQNRARVRAAVSPVTGGCFAFVDRLRCCCCSYGLPVTGQHALGLAWAPSSRPPASSNIAWRGAPLCFRAASSSRAARGSRHMEHNWNAPPWSSLASGNLSVGLVLLCLEHPLLADVHLLVVPVRQALMLILGSLSCQLSPSGRGG
ncbi:uncharacterized protein LOC125551381 isoform X1 [Triticum urartu]|uniref:uncharacterized protein LOC125551381 isoform X1 n=1 Tax=Triticum urartu TaxID=4572 RepID=UPI0020441CBA|nr:uncharacterized protein LOC125551381 isoform X1 [Triticum urartu]